MNPTVQAAIDAITKVDTDLTAANSAVQTAAELHTQDQQTIQDLQAKLAKAQQPAPPPPVTARPYKARCFDLDFDTGLKGELGSVATVGAKGRTHGTYTRTINADGTNVWQFQPKHFQGSATEPPDPWDGFFIDRNVTAFDANISGAIFKICFRFPTTLDFDRCEQIETNWEIQQPDYSTLNWGWALNIGGNDGFKWFDFANHKWTALGMDSSAIAKDLRAGKVLQLTQILRRDGQNAIFDSFMLNGSTLPVNKSQPNITRDNRKADKWSPFVQWAWQADAKGQDQPFTVITYGMSVVVY